EPRPTGSATNGSYRGSANASLSSATNGSAQPAAGFTLSTTANRSRTRTRRGPRLRVGRSRPARLCASLAEVRRARRRNAFRVAGRGGHPGTDRREGRTKLVETCGLPWAEPPRNRLYSSIEGLQARQLGGDVVLHDAAR